MAIKEKSITGSSARPTGRVMVLNPHEPPEDQFIHVEARFWPIESLTPEPNEIYWLWSKDWQDANNPSGVVDGVWMGDQWHIYYMGDYREGIENDTACPTHWAERLGPGGNDPYIGQDL